MCISTFRDIEIEDKYRKTSYKFVANRWLSVVLGDGRVSAFVPASTEEEWNDFKYVYSNVAGAKFRSSHSWYAVYGKPPEDDFARKDR